MKHKQHRDGLLLLTAFNPSMGELSALLGNKKLLAL